MKEKVPNYIEVHIKDTRAAIRKRLSMQNGLKECYQELNQTHQNLVRDDAENEFSITPINEKQINITVNKRRKKTPPHRRYEEKKIKKMKSKKNRYTLRKNKKI